MAEAAVQARPIDPLVTVRFRKRVRQYNPGEQAGFPLSTARQWVAKGICTILDEEEATLRAEADAESVPAPEAEPPAQTNPPLPEKETGGPVTGTRTKKT